MIDSLLSDFRLALRGLRRSPGFFAVAILILAIGIGAGTAMFSVLYGVVYRPLGYRNEGRLATLVADNPEEGAKGRGNYLPDFWEWRRDARSFEELAFYGWRTMTLEEPGNIRQMRSVCVSANYFRTLGIDPVLGRTFTGDDEVPGRGHAAMISYNLWQSQYGGDRGVLGRAVPLDGRLITIVGVLPRGVRAPSPEAELWIPVGDPGKETGEFSREERDFQVIGRLKKGVSMAQAQGEIDNLASALAQRHRATNQGWRIRLAPVAELYSAYAEPALWAAFGAVTLLLLIACSNVANLALLRSLGRGGDWAVRLALGAGRLRLARQQTIESLIPGIGGGTLGIAVALGLQKALLALEPGILPRKESIALDWPVFAFALAASTATALALGVLSLPRRGALTSALKSSQRGGDASHANRIRMVLAVGEIGLSLTLVAGAALLAQAFFQLSAVDPGFQPRGVFSAHIIDDQDARSLAARRGYFRQVLAEARAIPGVRSAGLTTTPPIPGLGIQIEVPFRGDDGPLVTEKGAPQAAFRVISPGYLKTIDLPLLQGRDFAWHDDEDAPPVALVNQALAERAWPEQAAVGQRLSIFFEEDLQYEVIGIVRNTRFAGLGSEPRPEVYLTHPQMPFLGISVAVRADLAPAAADKALREATLRVRATQPVNRVFSWERELGESLAVERFYSTLLGVFALLALFLSAAGVYGVVGHWVSQRTREFGIRMALGAGVRQILLLVLGRGARMTLVGLLAGSAGVYVLSRFLAGAFQGVRGLEPGILVASAGLLSAAALAACLMPARRAGRVHPASALRSE